MYLSRITRKILVCILPTLIIVGGFILLYDVSSVLANEGAGQTPQPAAPGPETVRTAMSGVLWWLVSSVFGGLAWATGGLLDFAILELVLGFGTLFKDTGLGVAVNQLWSVVRDIFNLTFIFGLVYIGFRLVIDSESSAARKAIVNLIIAALLVNFSLFITKTVIDFSNIAAVQIAGLIYNNNAIPTATGAAGGAQNNKPSISLAFGQQMGLSGLWGQTDAERSAARGTPGGSGGLLYIFGVMILFIIASFCFVVGFVMLLSRFITLNFMMILSPIMFLGLVFSSLSSYSKDYWNKFLKTCFFAPAFLLMLYFSLYVLGTFTSVIRGNTTGAGTLMNGGDINAIAGFLLGGGFLIASVLIAQKMSMAGSSTMIKFGNSMVGKARGMATGAGRFAGRSTVGVAAQGVGYGAQKVSASLNNRLGKMAQSENKWARRTARTLERTVGAGIKSAEGATAFGSETAEARDKRVKEQQARFNTTNQVETRGEVIKKQLSEIGANTADNPAAREARATANNLLAAQVRKMSNDEVLDLDKAILESPEFGQHLTDAHITALRGSGAYTNAQAGVISTNRDIGTFAETARTLDSTNASLIELNTTFEQLAQTVQRIPIDRLQGFTVPAPGAPITATSLTNERIATNLSDKQIEDLQNSGRFDARQMQQIRNARTAGLTAIASGTAPGLADDTNANHGAAIAQLRDNLINGNDTVLGNLPVSFLLDRNIVPRLTPRIIEAKMRTGSGLSDADRMQLDLALIGHWAGGGRPANWDAWARTVRGAAFFA